MADEDDKGKGSDLVKVRYGVDGGELAVSDKAPGIFARMLPISLTGRKQIERAIVGEIERKIGSGEAHADAEVEFAEAKLGDDVSRFMRLEQIRRRAIEVYKALPPAPTPLQLPPKEEQSERPDDQKTTADDWVNRFRDDAGLVDDQTLREIYARVLAGEARAPGSVSLRTLGVLRYLDQETAEQFARLMKVVISWQYIPSQHGTTGQDLMARLGLPHAVLVTLTEAGLVNADVATQVTRPPTKAVVFGLSGHRRLLCIESPDSSEFVLPLSVHMLTRAGWDLAQIAEIEEDPNALEELLAWFGIHARGKQYMTAQLPHPQWTGDAGTLEWSESSTWPA